MVFCTQTMALQLIESLIKIVENKVQADEVRSLFVSAHPDWERAMAMGVKRYELRDRRCEGCKTRECYTASECTCAAPKLAGYYMVLADGRELGPCPLNGRGVQPRLDAIVDGGADAKSMYSNDANAGNDGGADAQTQMSSDGDDYV